MNNSNQQPLRIQQCQTAERHRFRSIQLPYLQNESPSLRIWRCWIRSRVWPEYELRFLRWPNWSIIMKLLWWLKNEWRGRKIESVPDRAFPWEMKCERESLLNLPLLCCSVTQCDKHFEWEMRVTATFQQFSFMCPPRVDFLVWAHSLKRFWAFF